MRHTPKKKPSSTVQVSRTSMNIDRSKIRRVRLILGAATDTEAVDKALDSVLANQEIQAAIDETFGAVPDFEVR